MTDEQLLQLAKDRLAGLVFFGDQVPPDLLPMVFMPLALMRPEEIQKLQDAGVVMLYEYLEQLPKKGTTAVNGFPVFFSFKGLTTVEVDKLNMYIDKLKAAEAAVLP